MTSVLADAGVPMIFIQFPAMVCLLIPVVMIETEVMRRELGVPFRQILGGVTRANLASTLMGLPLAWLAMSILEGVTILSVLLGTRAFSSGHNPAASTQAQTPTSPIQALLLVFVTFPTIPPGNLPYYWMVPAASVLLLLPTFFVSVWMERRSCLRYWGLMFEDAPVRRAVWKANVASYILLFAIACVWLVYSIIAGPNSSFV